MNPMLPNNSKEANDKLNELLSPLLEFLNTLNPDKGKAGFFSETEDSFKSSTIKIEITEKHRPF